MTSKADLEKENQKTREVKEQDEYLRVKAEQAVHDVKKGVKDLANKTENMDLKDIPDRLIPSAEKVDQKLEGLQDSIEDARHAQIGEKDLTRYPKIQQVMKDVQNIVGDERAMLKNATKDNTLSETAHHTAELAQLLKDQTLVSLDSLWTNWAAFLTVVAGSSAGSWKQILLESGNVLNQLRYTQDFIQLLADLQRTLSTLATKAAKDQPVGEKLDKLNAEWEKQREQLLADWKKVWSVLSESPLWKQLLAKGKAFKEQAAKIAGETKEEVQKSADKVADSAEVSKLKDDFKNVLQLIVGKDGPSVGPFLDYCRDAYTDIVENEEFGKWASEMTDLFETMGKSSENAEEYQKHMDSMYEQTKELLDNTVKNENLKLALRESKKLMRAAKADPATKKLLKDAGKLFKDISDKKGLNLMDPQLLNEIRAVIVPIMVDHFDNTPLPDYHGYASTALGKYDYTLSGIRIGATGLVPDKVKIQFRYKAEANPSQLKVEKQKMLMYIEASDIQLAFKDVKWVYNRHTIPRFSDNGTIDLATAGKGITLKLKAEMHNFEAPEHAHNLTELLSEPKERHMFTVVRAECLIDDFHVRISDTGASNVFYEMLAGIWGTKIKHELESLIEIKMNLLCDKFDNTIYNVVLRATQPSLAEETKSALLSIGTSAGDKIKETAAEAKASLQSM